MSKWTIDPMHSEVHFKVKHLVITTVTGSFKKFEGEADAPNDDFIGASIRFSIDADSIDTNQAQRDGHLKSADFFDVANHPKIEFKSTSVTQKSGNDYIINGDLSMRGVTKPVELKAEFGGTTKDSYGNVKAGFEVTGVIVRKDFGIAFNGQNEAGVWILGEDIKISINVELAKQA